MVCPVRQKRFTESNIEPGLLSETNFALLESLPIDSLVVRAALISRFPVLIRRRLRIPFLKINTETGFRSLSSSMLRQRLLRVSGAHTMENQSPFCLVNGQQVPECTRNSHKYFINSSSHVFLVRSLHITYIEARSPSSHRMLGGKVDYILTKCT